MTDTGTGLERENRDEALRAAEARLQLALDVGGLGVWELDLASDTATRSLRHDQIFGYDALLPAWGYGPFMRHVLPEDRAEVDRRFRRAIEAGSEWHFECRIRRADGEVRWIEARGRPFRDGAGSIVRLTGVVADITERKSGEAALRAQGRELRLLMDSLPGVVIRLDREERYLFANATYEAWFGVKPGDLVGRTLRETIGEEAYRFAKPFYARALQGEPVSFENRAGRPGLPERYIRVSLVPDRDEAGRVQGCYALGTDITDRKRAEQHRELLMAELSHRMKNTLALVQATFQQSWRASRDPEDFQAAFAGRLSAMAAAHDLLTRNSWEGSALAKLSARVLQPYGFEEGRIALNGESEVVLKPHTAVTLAMVLHELATNAAKYGALSIRRGRVRLSWTVGAAHLGPALVLRWLEEGGPPVAEPARAGFGRRLIERAVAYELDGKAELHFAPSGLECRLQFPLRPDVGRRP